MIFFLNLCFRACRRHGQSPRQTVHQHLIRGDLGNGRHTLHASPRGRGMSRAEGVEGGRGGIAAERPRGGCNRGTRPAPEQFAAAVVRASGLHLLLRFVRRLPRETNIQLQTALIPCGNRQFPYGSRQFPYGINAVCYVLIRSASGLQTSADSGCKPSAGDSCRCKSPRPPNRPGPQRANQAPSHRLALVTKLSKQCQPEGVRLDRHIP